MPNTEHKPTERVLNILELLGTTPSGLSLSDIAKQIGSPKTTVAPILHTMASRNFIAYHKDSSLYTIGIGAYLAGISYYGEKSIMQFINPKWNMRSMKQTKSANSESVPITACSI